MPSFGSGIRRYRCGLSRRIHRGQRKRVRVECGVHPAFRSMFRCWTCQGRHPTLPLFSLEVAYPRTLSMTRGHHRDRRRLRDVRPRPPPDRHRLITTTSPPPPARSCCPVRFRPFFSWIAPPPSFIPPPAFLFLLVLVVSVIGDQDDRQIRCGAQRFRRTLPRPLSPRLHRECRFILAHSLILVAIRVGSWFGFILRRKHRIEIAIESEFIWVPR